MFKQFKSAFIWYAIFKWRKRLSIVAFLLMITLFSFIIYDDLVGYLKLTNQLEYLKYLLLAKWTIVFSSILSSLFLLKNIWKENLLTKKNNKEKKKQQKEQQNVEEKAAEMAEMRAWANKEEYFLNKDHLQSEAERLIARKAYEKSKQENSQK